MTLRKKLAVTTIAASVAMSAFAGIPLSNKGLAEKLGVSNVAYAAAVSNYDRFVERADRVYSKLDAAGVEAINLFRADVEDVLLNKSTALDVLVAKIPAEAGVQDDVKALIKDLLATQITADWQKDYEALAKENEGLLNSLHEGLGVNDLANVILTIEVGIGSDLANAKTPGDLLKLKEKIKVKVTEAVKQNANVAAFAKKFDITSDELSEIFVELQNEVSVSKAYNALTALQAAYKKAYPTTGGGGGEAGPIVDNSITAEAQTLVNNLDELKAKLAAATDEEKAKLIEDAVKQVSDLVNKLAVISAKVDVVEGKATISIDESTTVVALNSIGAVIAKLQEVANVSYDAPKLVANAGDVTENEVAVTLTASVVAAAIKAKVPAISLKIGAFGVDLPFGGTFNKKVDFGFKKSDADEAVLGGLKAASQVYDFSLSVDGVTTTSFDRPIVITLPLGNITGLDKELLSVAKIVEGGLEFHGGRVTDTSVIESRDSFSSYVVVENKVTFGDIAHVSSWAGRAIEVVAAKGAINGKAEGVFDPNANVTRAEFAKMLVRALDLENGSATENFADVNTNDWFAPYVAAASQAGIIKGKSATKFDPSAPIKRAEMATMITRALQLVNGSKDVADIEAALAKFADADQINETLRAGVAFAADKEIVVGNNGKFDPVASATRAQAAVIIYRAINAN